MPQASGLSRSRSLVQGLNLCGVPLVERRHAPRLVVPGVLTGLRRGSRRVVEPRGRAALGLAGGGGAQRDQRGGGGQDGAGGNSADPGVGGGGLFIFPSAWVFL